MRTFEGAIGEKMLGGIILQALYFFFFITFNKYFFVFASEQFDSNMYLEDLLDSRMAVLVAFFTKSTIIVNTLFSIYIN